MTGNLPHWLSKTFTMTLSGTGNRTVEQDYKMNLPTLPHLRWTLAESANETFTVGIQYSFDNTNFSELVTSVTGQEDAATAEVDLSSQGSGKPSNSIYVRVRLTASGTIASDESATLTLKFFKWLDDQGQDIFEDGDAVTTTGT